MFQNAYRNKTIFLTGHTGFKGSWLAYWLRQLGANVVGYSLPAPTVPSHHDLLAFGRKRKRWLNLNDLGYADTGYSGRPARHCFSYGGPTAGARIVPYPPGKRWKTNIFRYSAVAGSGTTNAVGARPW